MSGPLPAAGYISNSSRTVADAQTEWELDIAIEKETLGGFSEGATLSIASNTITPVNNACVYPVDASGGGTINTIQTTNIRDGQVIFLHCVSSSDPITIANLASGTGAAIATFSGQNIVLTNPAMFISLKYNATTNEFQELFPSPTWSAPGPIGSTTPNTGEFTTLTLTGAVAAHKWLGNSSASSAAPSFSSITAADLPSTTVNSVGSLSPIFSASVSAQAISFTLSNAAAGSLFGNFSGSSGAPSYNAPGSADQILGVAHTGGGLEYKTLTAGANITITPGAGSITIAATGGSSSQPEDVAMDGVVQGLNTYTSSSLTATLNTNPNSSGGNAVMIVLGTRISISFGDSRLAITVSASKDTYIDVSSAGTFTATAVSNGAAAPATITNNLRLCKIISGASSITAVDYIAPTVKQELPIVEWTPGGNYAQTSQSDGVICPISSLSTLSSLTTTMVPAGLGVLIIQGGKPYWIPVGDSRLTNTYTASKDTYIDFSAGSFVYTTVANNASPPSLTSGYTRVGLVVSGASTITGAYWFAGSASLVSGLGGGGNISAPNAVPASGTWSGEYWQYGSFSTTGTITTNQGRIHVVGDVIINNAITVSTEMPGGSGTQWNDSFSMSGCPGAGVAGGSNGILYVGGGGGGNGGAGGGGGSRLASATAAGGPAIPFLTLTGSGGGAGGDYNSNPGTLNAGGAGGGGLYIEASGNIYVLANISANGAAGTSTSTSEAGGGGGGSGGCIELRAGGQVYVASSATLSANGGAGGNSTGSNTGGGGGGGGGGFIRLKGAHVNNRGTLSVSGGAAGSGNSSQAATAGSTGVTDTTAVVWGPRSPS